MGQELLIGKRMTQRLLHHLKSAPAHVKTSESRSPGALFMIDKQSDRSRGLFWAPWLASITHISLFAPHSSIGLLVQ